MRPLRNPLIAAAPAWVALGLIMLVGCERNGGGTAPTAPPMNAEQTNGPEAAPEPQPPPGQTDYFPLEVANSWTYECFAEGELQLEKSVEITGRAVVEGRAGFEIQSVINGEKSSGFLWEESDGTVYMAGPDPGNSGEPIVSRTARIGQDFGDLRATRVAEQETPATGKVTVLVLETFDADDPALTDQRRMEWRGKFFANGIGLVAEGDGLGNECSLVRFVVKSRPSPAGQ
jgi:hypothetical protein